MPPNNLEHIAREIRAKVIEMTHCAKTPHLGSSLSCVDILVAAYWSVLRIDPKKPADPDRDRLILSKGHAAPALYAALAYRGFCSIDKLTTFGKNGSNLTEHPSLGCLPGVEASTGSLGHGLPIAVGMSLAAKIKKKDHRVFAILSDGECNEGSVWEAALFAPIHHLDRLAVIIDFNRWQATARSCETMALEPFMDKWKAFGWSVYSVNGHEIQELSQRMNSVPDSSGKPVAIIANTIKGKGVSFMEDDNNWHYRIPTAEEVVLAKKELGLP
jgi:transketolase